MSGLKNLKLQKESRLPKISVDIVSAEPLKRLTIDVPLSVHIWLKTESAKRQVSIRDLALKAFADLSTENSCIGLNKKINELQASAMCCRDKKKSLSSAQKRENPLGGGFFRVIKAVRDNLILDLEPESYVPTASNTRGNA